MLGGTGLHTGTILPVQPHQRPSRSLSGVPVYSSPARYSAPVEANETCHSTAASTSRPQNLGGQFQCVREGTVHLAEGSNDSRFRNVCRARRLFGGRELLAHAACDDIGLTDGGALQHLRNHVILVEYCRAFELFATTTGGELRPSRSAPRQKQQATS
ncbi:hypothetical protein OH77DRAFT_502763 [Trametes cingulata]|nr:hypothetical protein OH77DRAFT_502763 [Trametes cingulata]